MSSVVKGLLEPVKRAVNSTLWKNRANVTRPKDVPSVDYLYGADEYRTVSPGSQKARVSVPDTDDPDLTYNIGFAGRDVQRNPELNRITYITRDPEKEAGVAVLGTDIPLLGSPGNNSADVARYDETLLRSSMSATNEQLIGGSICW